MRRLCLLLACSGLLVALPACQQVRCAWDTTSAKVSQVFTCGAPQEPCGVVYTEPVYDIGCGGDPRVGSGGTGAFRTP